MERFFSWHWDAVGFGASLLCALHCTLLLLILPLGILAEAHWLINPIGERIFIGISIGIASWSLLMSYFKKHQNIRPLSMAGLGFLGLFITQMNVVSSTHELTTISGGLIAYAHFYNWHLVHQAKAIVIKVRQWSAPYRLVTIALLLFYFIGLYSAFTHENVPPDRQKMLEVVWRVSD
ncbi:MAG: MerC domain-containing protein [Bacteroidota bacterium]